MKFLTYNILDGGQGRLPLIKQIVRDQSPDYLTLNEANGFSDHGNKILKQFAFDTGFEYFDIALSGQYDYHVAVFSKYKFENTIKLQPLMRACLINTIETKIGLLSIASLHLTPMTEDLRHPEIDLVVGSQKGTENTILTGDMNSLSHRDGYPEDMVEDFNETQLKKFTTDGELRFSAIKKIENSGYIDVAAELRKGDQNTVPTPMNKDKAHSKMRLDYFFVSKSLKPMLVEYSVVKNELTDKASDHYPIIMELKDL